MVQISVALRRLVPLFDRVLVKKIEPITQSKGGVLLPEKSSRPMSATVIEVGQGLRNEDGEYVPLAVKVGDEVVVPEYGGTKLNYEEQDLYIFKETDLLGKILK